MTQVLPAVPQAPQVQLWRIDLQGHASPDDWAVLDAQERERATRFAFEHLRRRHVIAHAALRRVLGTLLGRDPAALAWVLGSHGKPALAGTSGLWFNLSHSDDVALLAVSATEELGVDVEVNPPQRPLRDAASLARSVLTEREQTWVHAEGPQDLERRFLCCWTRKEACIKAIGSGLSLAPQTFDAGDGNTTTALSLHWNDRHWPLTVMPLDAGNDVTAALAICRSG